MADHSVALEELSLVGLFHRLKQAEQYKEAANVSEEEQAVVDSEPAIKKTVAERLGAVGDTGLTPLEKKKAKEFLEAQVKSVDPNARGAEKRTAMLKEILSGVDKAPQQEDPAHVRKASADLAKIKKAFDEVHKEYDKWEKGKKTVSVDELKTLKRNHEEQMHRLEAAKLFVETQLHRRPECAAALPKQLEQDRGKMAATIAPGKAAAPKAVRGGGPAARMSGTVHHGPPRSAGGYPPASAGPGTSSSVALQLRMESEQAERDRAAREAAAAAAQAEQAEQAERARPPRQKPPKYGLGEVEQGPVLSYECTVQAVAEHLGISKDRARDTAASSKEFRVACGFDAAAWSWIEERSLAIEKQNREDQKDKEKRKQAQAMARATDKLGTTVAPLPPRQRAAQKPPPGASPAAVAPKAAPPAATKAKAKAKAAAARQSSGLGALAGANAFGAFESDSDDADADGFTRVRKR